jgi:hypothetical protein
MRGNIVLAAAVFALGVVVGCLVLVFGVRWALNDAADRLAESVQRHGDLTRSAGERAGEPIQTALNGLGERVAQHAAALEKSGQMISVPRVTLLGPVPIIDQEPLRVRGIRGQDGSLPVDVQLQGKDK